jgi:hypothetical protein
MSVVRVEDVRVVDHVGTVDDRHPDRAQPPYLVFALACLVAFALIVALTLALTPG